MGPTAHEAIVPANPIADKGYGLMNKFFGLSGANGTQQPVADMNITGEGTQPLNDMAWKRKENKYLGANSINDKEQRE